MSSDARQAELENTGLVDKDVFGQILEMDDDPADREFSKSIVYDFFDQAKETLEKMDEALNEENLKELKDLGHFLKGSSATLGLTRVKDNCEKIQNYGDRKDATGANPEPDDKLSLARIGDSIAAAKMDFLEVEKVLRRFYDD